MEEAKNPDIPSDPALAGLTQEQVRAHYAEGKKRMVRKLLALGYEMRYDKPESPAEERMERWRVNMNHVNRFFKSEKGVVHKEIDRMTYSELSKAVTQFTEIYKDFSKRV